MKISHMKKDELFEGFYLIKSADLRQTRAGKNYLAFTFQDDSGEIEGKLWDAQPHNVEAFTAGKVVHMKGRREVYNNTQFGACDKNGIEIVRLCSNRSRICG